MPVFDPNRYSEISVRDLLTGVAQGYIGADRRLLRSLMDRGPAAAAEALAFTREPVTDHKINLDSVLVDLFRHWGTPEALEFYVDVIRRNPGDVIDELVQALLPFGAKAVDPLLKLYGELEEEDSSDVAFMLAGLRQHDPRVLAILLDRLEFDAADGAFCLGLYGDPAARPALQKMLAEIDPAETDLLREVQFALEQLDAPEPEYQPEPVDILAEYPERDTPALDMLTDSERLEMLASTDADTRAEAAHTFFNQDLDPRTTAALLNLAKTDPEVKVRARGWASLADQTSDETDGSRIREAMLAVAKDPARDVIERGGAAVGLYGVADRKDVQPVIEALYEEGGHARAKAMESMWRSLYKPYAKYFAPHLDDDDVSILRQAIRGVGYFRLTAQAGRVSEFFEPDEEKYGSKVDDLREDALFAYALAMPGETTRGRMKGMLRKIDELAQLSPAETDLVMFALDERLALQGLDPVFAEAEHDHDHDHGHSHEGRDHHHHHEHSHGGAEMSIGPSVNGLISGAAAPAPKVGRNDACPCGSGKKFKKCHGA